MKQFRVMISPSIKYQKTEIEIIADTKEELLEEVAWAEQYAKDKVVELVEFASKYEEPKAPTNNAVKPVPVQTVSTQPVQNRVGMATPKQLEYLNRNDEKARQIAAEMGIVNYDPTSLTTKQAGDILNRIYGNKKTTNYQQNTNSTNSNVGF